MLVACGQPGFLLKENGLFLKAEGGAVKIHSIQVWRMSSAWPGAIPD
jgi:hypothetical protein